MSAINGLGTYVNAMNLYALGVNSDNQNTSDGSTARYAGSSVVNLLTQNLQGSGQSLTEQLTGLVRLTRYAMDAMGLASDSRVTFSKLQEYCNQVQESFSSAVKTGLSEAQTDLSKTIFTLDSYGTLKVQSATRVNAALTELAIDNNADLVADLYKDLQTAGINLQAGFRFMLTEDGLLKIDGTNAEAEALLNGKEIRAASLAAKITAQKIDPNIDFSLQTNDNDSVTVNCADKSYTSVLQAFFDENPAIVKDFQRSEALSGIEDARKFVALSPRDIRTRVQLASMAAWWDNSSQASSSSFGTYSSGIYSRLSGINLSV